MNTVREGRTCLLSSVVNAAYRHAPSLTEEHLFLSGGGNRLDYRFSSDDGTPEIFVGHHSSDILARCCERIGVRHEMRDGADSNENLLEELRNAFSTSHAVVIWVDMSSLPYLKFVPPKGAIHAVAVTRVEQRVLTVVDCFVPQGLYSDAVSTHCERISIDQFAAWRETGFCRHLINLDQLTDATRHSGSRIFIDGLRMAAMDYLQGSERYPATRDVLACLAEDLPQIHDNFPGGGYPQLYTALAYNIRYFGTLWSREFIGRALTQVPDSVGGIGAPMLAERFHEAVRKWKFIMLDVLKVPHVRNPRAFAYRLRDKMHALLRVESEMYEQLLNEIAPLTNDAKYKYDQEQRRGVNA